MRGEVVIWNVILLEKRCYGAHVVGLGQGILFVLEVENGRWILKGSVCALRLLFSVEENANAR